MFVFIFVTMSSLVRRSLIYSPSFHGLYVDSAFLMWFWYLIWWKFKALFVFIWVSVWVLWFSIFFVILIIQLILYFNVLLSFLYCWLPFLLTFPCTLRDQHRKCSVDDSATSRYSLFFLKAILIKSSNIPGPNLFFLPLLLLLVQDRRVHRIVCIRDLSISSLSRVSLPPF